MSTARAELDARGLTTWSAARSRIADTIAADPSFEAAIIDESQDLSVAELHFLTAFGTAGSDLFLASDIGQRIFRQPFSWRTLGVDIRGRSCVLKVNYRTSEQIRRRADRLLPGMIVDGDGAEKDRRGVVSVFGGLQPATYEARNEDAEITHVAGWLSARIADGMEPGEIGVFAHTDEAAERGARACEAASIPFRCGVFGPEDERRVATVCNMSLAKGLEFRAVAVVACDENLLRPLRMSRARGLRAGAARDIRDGTPPALCCQYAGARRVHASGVTPVSEFLTELQGKLQDQ